MEAITNDLESFFSPLGLEVHPFQIGWYNDAVSEHFKLKFEPDAIAFVAISTPSMFEDAFIPYLKENLSKIGVASRDPLDSCMRHFFQEAATKIPSCHVEIIQDFEILPNKRPRILVQTAAHVAGAAYYYQKNDVENLHSGGCFIRQQSDSDGQVADNNCDGQKSQRRNDVCSQSSRQIHDSYGNKTHCDANRDHSEDEDKPKIERLTGCVCVDPWGDSKRIYGVCIHPKYGGWFAIRGVLIIPGLRADIQQRAPVNCVKTRESRIELLNRFNGNWQDWTFRDIIPVTKKYSELQKKYFATAPKDRHSLLSEIVNY